MDETYLYIVDSGPNIGERTSNAWFKFERDGTPVSSSAVTDFVDSIFGPEDDSVIDGITWCPPTSPVAPGLFLVAVEHNGIMVIDEHGFSVDQLVWEEVGLVYGEAVPFAFAGITIDPVRGDLYLVENSGAQCQVWVRVQPDEPVFLGSRSWLHGPDLECERHLLLEDAAAGLVFGHAYRPEDGMVWGTDWNTGDHREGQPALGPDRGGHPQRRLAHELVGDGVRRRSRCAVHVQLERHGVRDRRSGESGAGGAPVVGGVGLRGDGHGVQHQRWDALHRDGVRGHERRSFASTRTPAWVRRWGRPSAWRG